MAKVKTIERLSRADAESLARHCMTAGRVIFGKHFREELANESLQITDARFVLKHGHIFTEPEPDIKTGEWKYRIDGKTLDQIDLSVVFCFKEIDTCFLITVF